MRWVSADTIRNHPGRASPYANRKVGTHDLRPTRLQHPNVTARAFSAEASSAETPGRRQMSMRTKPIVSSTEVLPHRPLTIMGGGMQGINPSGLQPDEERLAGHLASGRAAVPGVRAVSGIAGDCCHRRRGRAGCRRRSWYVRRSAGAVGIPRAPGGSGAAACAAGERRLTAIRRRAAVTAGRQGSLISGEHCREAFLQILDEIPGNLQRREMSPGSGCLPSDDLPVPLLCPGARALLDVAGIHADC